MCTMFPSATVVARLDGELIMQICINEETRTFTDAVPDTFQVEKSIWDPTFDVHLSHQHREKPSKIESQVILSTGKCLILCR